VELLDSISTATVLYSSLFGDTYLVSERSPALSIALRSTAVQETPQVMAETTSPGPSPSSALLSSLVASSS
jgi:hypothetical protein